MAEPRKATDVLLALEAKVETLSKQMYSLDFNMKVLINKINSISASSQMTQQSMLPVDPDKEIVQIHQEEIIPLANKMEDFTGHRRTARAEAYADNTAATAADPRAPMRPEVQATKQLIDTANAGKKVPVVQRVSDSSAKDLFMAAVSITDMEGNSVYNTKTSASGKWSALLQPGKYKVKIIKTDTATKKKTEALQEINVRDTGSVMTLPTAIIKKG
jgi:hypothetical protein